MSIRGSLEVQPRQQSMEVDRIGVGESNPPCAKLVIEEGVGEADRMEDGNIHLSRLELFTKSHGCILRPIVIEP